MGFPVIVALNMMDVAEQNGLAVDMNRLRNCLGVPAIPTVGWKRQGKRGEKPAYRIRKLELSLQALQEAISQEEPAGAYSTR